MVNYPTTNRSQRKPRKKLLLIVILILILLVGGGAYWWHRHHDTAKQTAISSGVATSNPNVPGSQTTTGNPTTGSSVSGAGNSKDTGGNTPGAAPNNSIQPTAPTGEFVSDHSPNLSDNPHPNTETSACTTTPGVKCQIRFTSGSIVKTLPAQTTDGNGNTIWSNWTLQGVGLTQGTWQVSAVATNGGKTASAQDSTPLVVSK